MVTYAYNTAMANLLAFLFGLFALLLAFIAFVPFMGWMNWFIIPIAVFGAICGVISSHNSGRNFCFIVIAICALRLWLGGGIF